MKSRNPICPSIGRRQFMQAAGVGGLALGGLSRARTASAADRYAGLATDKYLGNVEVLTKVQARKVFTEGPAVDREGNVFFTNIPASQILKWSPAEKTLMVFRDKSNAANGLLFDPQGRLLACEGAAGRVTRTNMKTGKVEVLADKFNGTQTPDFRNVGCLHICISEMKNALSKPRQLMAWAPQNA